MITAPKQEYSGKAWGTIAGKGISTDPPDKWDAAVDSKYSIRKTSNKGTDGNNLAFCDKSYLMITGILNSAPSTTSMTVKLNVTAEPFAKTFREKIPTRPDAVVAPIDGPTKAINYKYDGARQLETFIGGLTAAGMLITSGLL